MPRFGDVFSALPIGDAAVLFVRVHERARMNHHQYLLSKGAIDSYELQRLLKEVVRNGGQWEVAMGGFLMVSLPEASTFDPTLHINALNKDG